MRRKIGLATVAILTIPFTVYSAKAIRLFCIGDSIVAGGFPDENLILLLGPSHNVYCAGSSHCTALRNTNVNIWTKGRWKEEWEYQPDAVTVMLGTNDTKDANWSTWGKNFEADYSDLLDTAGSVQSKPVVIPVLSPPIFTNGMGINNDIMAKNIIPLQKKVSDAKKLAYIDANTPLLGHSEVFADGVHPNEVGRDSLAAIYYRGIASMSKRIACITDYAPMVTNAKTGKLWPDSLSYPVQLGRRFGWGTLVQNFGATGATIRKNGKTPILSQDRLKSLRNWKPHVVAIMLGTFDAPASGWDPTAFEQDLSSLIDSLSTIKPKPDIRLVLPPPVFKSSSSIDATTLKDKTIPAILKVASSKSISVIDANSRFKALERLVPDGVVPDAEGQDSIAAILYEALGSPATGAGERPCASKLSARPTRNTLMIQTEGAVDLEIDLFALDGRNVLSQRIPSSLASSPIEIPLDGLGKGAFLYRIRSGSTSRRGSFNHF